MSEHDHLLEIYEPYDYNGPNPLHACGLGVLQGPAGSRYYLLSVNPALHIEETEVSQFVVECRYSGDGIERPTTSACTVIISRVSDGVCLDADSQVSYKDFSRWGVGKITPTNGD